jgi:hypothetical protein
MPRSTTVCDSGVSQKRHEAIHDTPCVLNVRAI